MSDNYGVDENGKPKKHVACTLCRKRKLKCDGAKPRCSGCEKNDYMCEYVPLHKKSGPKKGYVRTLEARVAQLEQLLREEQAVESSPLDKPAAEESNTKDPSQREKEKSEHESRIERLRSSLSDEVTKVLINGFFERSHRALMFINRLSFLSRLDLPDKDERPSLQLKYAILCIGAWNISKYSFLCEFLYEESLYHANNFEVSSHNMNQNDLEHLQTLILLSCHECRCGRFASAYLTGGAVIRKIQLLKLLALDNYYAEEPVIKSDSILKDEQRRTFYAALYLDYICTSGTGLPSVLRFDDIFVKLPIDDDKFDIGEPSYCVSYDLLLSNPRVLVQILDEGKINNFEAKIAAPTPIARQWDPIKNPNTVVFALHLLVGSVICRNSDLMRFPKKKFDDASVCGSWLDWYKKARLEVFYATSLIPPVLHLVKSGEYSSTQIAVLTSLVIHFHAAALDVSRAGLIGLHHRPDLQEHIEARNDLIIRCGLAAGRVVSSSKYVVDVAELMYDTFTVFSLYCVAKYFAAIMCTGSSESYRLLPQAEHVFKTLGYMSRISPSAGAFRQRAIEFLPPCIQERFENDGSVSEGSDLIRCTTFRDRSPKGSCPKSPEVDDAVSRVHSNLIHESVMLDGDIIPDAADEAHDTSDTPARSFSSLDNSGSSGEVAMYESDSIEPSKQQTPKLVDSAVSVDMLAGDESVWEDLMGDLSGYAGIDTQEFSRPFFSG